MVLLDGYVEIKIRDLLHKIFSVVDDMSSTHTFARLDCLVARCCSHNDREFQDLSRKLDSSTANTTTAIDLPGNIISRAHFQ